MSTEKLRDFPITEDFISYVCKEIIARVGHMYPWCFIGAEIAFNNHNTEMRLTRTQKIEHLDVKLYCHKKPKWITQLVILIYKHEDGSLRLNLSDEDLVRLIKKKLGRNDDRTIKKYRGYLIELGYIELVFRKPAKFTNKQKTLWKVNTAAIEKDFPELKNSSTLEQLLNSYNN